MTYISTLLLMNFITLIYNLSIQNDYSFIFYFTNYKKNLYFARKRFLITPQLFKIIQTSHFNHLHNEIKV